MAYQKKTAVLLTMTLAAALLLTACGNAGHEPPASSPPSAPQTESTPSPSLPPESGTTPDLPAEPEASTQPEDAEQLEAAPRLNLQIGDETFTITLEDNETTRALLESLPMTITMEEMNGNEKYTFMDGGLPTNSSNPGQIEIGDFMPYGDNCLVLFFKSFSTSFSYTRLGWVDDPDAFAAALTSGGVDVTLETASERRFER